MNILFVCMGNTCRSPMAEGIFNARKHPNMTASSAGLEAVEGAPASGNAVRAMRDMGIDISLHQAKQISQEDIDKADLIVPLDRFYATRLRASFERTKDKIRFSMTIPDPYGGDETVYKLCAECIEYQIDTLMPDIRLNGTNDPDAIAAYEAEAFPDGLSAESLREILQKKDYLTLGLYKRGRLASYIVSSISLGEAQILSVGSLVRNKGYATAAMNYFLQLLTKQNVTKVFLEVRASNAPALRVYEKCGFVKDGVRKNLYERPSEDGIIMHKDLIKC